MNKKYLALFLALIYPVHTGHAQELSSVNATAVSEINAKSAFNLVLHNSQNPAEMPWAIKEGFIPDDSEDLKTFLKESIPSLYGFMRAQISPPQKISSTLIRDAKKYSGFSINDNKLTYALVEHITDIRESGSYIYMQALGYEATQHGTTRPWQSSRKVMWEALLSRTGQNNYFLENLQLRSYPPNLVTCNNVNEVVTFEFEPEFRILNTKDYSNPTASGDTITAAYNLNPFNTANPKYGMPSWVINASEKAPNSARKDIKAFLKTALPEIYSRLSQAQGSQLRTFVNEDIIQSGEEKASAILGDNNIWSVEIFDIYDIKISETASSYQAYVASVDGSLKNQSPSGSSMSGNIVWKILLKDIDGRGAFTVDGLQQYQMNYEENCLYQHKHQSTEGQ